MSRRFAADNSEIRWTLPSAANPTGAFTLAVLLRRRSIGTVQTPIAHHRVSGANGVNGFQFNASNGLHYITNAGVGPASTSTITSTTNWYVIAMTKTSGTTAPRFHWKDLTSGGAVVHENAGATLGNPTSGLDGTIRVGEFEDGTDLDANLALIACWPTVALSDSQFEELYANNRTSDWWNNSAGNPAYLFQFNQTNTSAPPMLVQKGVAHIVTSGTAADAATDPPSWNYNGTAPAAPATDTTNNIGAALIGSGRIGHPVLIPNLSMQPYIGAT